MKRQKVLIAVILCFLIGNICKGFPSPLKRRDASYSVTPSFHDANHQGSSTPPGTLADSTGAVYDVTSQPFGVSVPVPLDFADESGHREGRKGSIKIDSDATNEAPRKVFSGTEDLQSQAKLGLTKQEEPTVDTGARRKRFSGANQQPKEGDELSMRKRRDSALAERPQSIKDSPPRHMLRMTSPRGASRQLRAPSVQSQKSIHGATHSVHGTDRILKTVVKSDEFAERPSNINTGQVETRQPKGKDHEPGVIKSSDKQRPKLISSEDNRIPVKASIKTNWNVQSRDDEDGSGKESSATGSYEWSHNTRVKQGPPWDLSSDASQEDSGRFRRQNNHQSKIDGKKGYGGQHATKRRFLTNIASNETHNQTNPSKKSDHHLENSRQNGHGKGNRTVHSHRFGKVKNKRGSSQMDRSKGRNRKIRPSPSRFTTGVSPEPQTPSPTSAVLGNNNTTATRGDGNIKDRITEPLSEEKPTEAAEEGVSKGTTVKPPENNSSSEAASSTSSNLTKATPLDGNLKPTNFSIKTGTVTEAAGENNNTNQDGKTGGAFGDGPDERGPGDTIHGIFITNYGTSAEENTSNPLQAGTHTVSMGIRWSVPYEPEKLPVGKIKTKKKKEEDEEEGEYENRDQDEERSSLSTLAKVFAAFMVVAMILPLIVMYAWRDCRPGFLRRNNPNNDSELGIPTASMTNFGYEQSDEEIIYERELQGQNKTSPHTNERDPSEQAVTFNTYSTDAPKTWTMSETPRSTPLMAAPTVPNTKKVDDFCVECEASEMERLLSPPGSSLSSETSFVPRNSLHSVSHTSTTPSTVSESRPQGTDGELFPISTPPLECQIKHGSSASGEEFSSLTPTHSVSFSDEPGNTESAIAAEAPGVVSAPNESSKKPVSPATDIVITIEDDEDPSEVRTSGNESRTQEFTHPSGNYEVGMKDDIAKATNGNMETEKVHKRLKLQKSPSESAQVVINILNEEGQVATSANERCKRETVYPSEKPDAGNQKDVAKDQAYETDGAKEERSPDVVKNQGYGMKDAELKQTSNLNDVGINIQDEKDSKGVLAFGNHSSKQENVDPAGDFGGKEKDVAADHGFGNSRVEEQLDDVMDRGYRIKKEKQAEQELKQESIANKPSVSRPPSSSPSINLLSSSPENKSVTSQSSLNVDDNKVGGIIKRPVSHRQTSDYKITERGKVMKEMVHELRDPSFEDRIRIAASTINPGERTKNLNEKCAYKRKVIKVDAQMLKAQKRGSSFRMDLKFVRSVILGPSTTNHDKNPEMGCVCYYCKNHWQKMGGPPCYKRPRRVSVCKDIILLDGGLLYFPQSSSQSSSCFQVPSRVASREYSGSRDNVTNATTPAN